MKCKCQRPVCSTAGVAPVRERGLKYSIGKVSANGRSRKGAWIEIDNTGYARQVPRVAPVRERGLKLRSEQHYAEWF